jgi:hypothetical protein
MSIWRKDVQETKEKLNNVDYGQENYYEDFKVHGHMSE